jgi:hypothetical protein
VPRLFWLLSGVLTFLPYRQTLFDLLDPVTLPGKFQSFFALLGHLQIVSIIGSYLGFQLSCSCCYILEEHDIQIQLFTQAISCSFLSHDPIYYWVIIKDIITVSGINIRT